MAYFIVFIHDNYFHYGNDQALMIVYCLFDHYAIGISVSIIMAYQYLAILASNCCQFLDPDTVQNHFIVMVTANSHSQPRS